MTPEQFIAQMKNIAPAIDAAEEDVLEFRHFFIKRAGKELRLTIPNATKEFNKFWKVINDNG